MTDFSKILDKAKELEAKMKESQKKIKEIRVEGVSGSNSVKVILDGEGEMQKIEISDWLPRDHQIHIRPSESYNSLSWLFIDCLAVHETVNKLFRSG